MQRLQDMSGDEIFFLALLFQVAFCIFFMMLIISARKRRAGLKRRGTAMPWLTNQDGKALSAGRLDDALLEEFMRTFFGYGTFQAKYWASWYGGRGRRILFLTRSSFSSPGRWS